MGTAKDIKDAQTYKSFAEKGMDLMFLVRINGRATRPDIQLPYHVTIMLFDPKKDSKEEAHEIASKLSLNPPNPKNTLIEFGTMEGRTGYTIYNVNLMGPENERIEELYKKFSKMGFHNGYKFQAHISIDKDTWDDLKAKNPKNAFEAGIEFLPAELRQGDKILANYKIDSPTDWGKEYPAEDKLAASENLAISVLKESAFYVTELFGSPVISLPDNTFKNWLQDNPEMKKKILEKHEGRVIYHFGKSEVAKYAIEHGISKTYELLRKK